MNEYKANSGNYVPFVDYSTSALNAPRSQSSDAPISLMGMMREFPFVVKVEYAESDIDRAGSTEVGSMLVGEIAPGWRVIRPIYVTLEPDEVGFVASDDVFAVYGVGDTLAEAWQDYIHSLIEYYELLEARSGNNAQTLELFEFLKQHIEH